MRLLLAVLIVTSPGCSLLFSSEAPGGAPDAATGAIDAMGADAMGCPGIELDLRSPGLHTLDTDSGIFSDPQGTTRTLASCLPPDSPSFKVSLAEFRIGNGDSAGGITILRVFGSKSLIVEALGNLTIDSNGGIDVSSGLGMPAGVGAAGDTMCDSKTVPAGAGGSGGALQELGGGGGAAGSGEFGPDQTLPLPRPDGPVGGCAGGSGGASVGDKSSGGAGGAGGGALQLLAADILIQGFVNAGGAGGGGGAGGDSGAATVSYGGGGGGGSGGTIWLEAPNVAITETGALLAKGGGGGEGGDTCNTGVDGSDARQATARQPAGGGVVVDACVAPGGTGGDGSGIDAAGVFVGATSGGPGVSNSNQDDGGGGGGGGGGSAGYIIVVTDGEPNVAPSSNIYPPFTVP